MGVGYCISKYTGEKKNNDLFISSKQKYTILETAFLQREASIGQFGAMGDPTTKIRNFFGMDGTQNLLLQLKISKSQEPFFLKLLFERNE